MTLTHICCCSVIVWCYVMIAFDMFQGTLFAMKHFDVDWIKSWRNKADKSTFWRQHDHCLDLGLGSVGMAIEMSLLVISLLALAALCCRKAVLLIPYLVLKVVVVILYCYMCVQYFLHYDQCKGMLFAQLLSILFSLCAYSIVVGAYRMIRAQQYSTVNTRYP